jgi:hypothetical protein
MALVVLTASRVPSGRIAELERRTLAAGPGFTEFSLAALSVLHPA